MLFKNYFFNKKDFFYSGSFLSTIGFIGGAIGYFFQLIMGRSLSSEDFVLFISVLNLVSFITSPVHSISMIVTRHTAENSSKNIGITNEFIGFVNNFTIYISLGYLVALFFSKFLILKYVNINDDVIYYLFLILVFFNIYNSNFNAVFQGMQKFVIYGLSGFLNHIFKFFAGIVFVFLGYKLLGAIFSVILAVFITNVILFYNLPNKKVNFKLSRKFLNFFSVKSISIVFLANFAIATVSQLDVIIASQIFDTNLAAKFTIISVFGKALLYLPSGFVLAVYPLASIEYAEGKSYLQNFIFCAILISLITIAGSIFLYFFSEYIFSYFYADKYQNVNWLLFLYGIAMLPLSIIILAENILIARRKIIFTWIFFIISPFQIYFMYHFSKNLEDLIFLMIYFNFTSLLIAIYFLIRDSLLKK